MSLTAFSAGPAAMIAQIIRELGMVEAIDNMAKWDPKQCKHSPGTHVLAMLINILMGRAALYRVDESYELQDVPVLFGTDASADGFNDSALGRTLAKIFDAGLKKASGAAALRAALSLFSAVEKAELPEYSRNIPRGHEQLPCRT